MVFRVFFSSKNFFLNLSFFFEIVKDERILISDF